MPSLLKPRGLHWRTIARLAQMPPARLDEPTTMFLCIGDHYEPMADSAPMAVQRERVERWVREYPRMAAGIEDSRGRPPQHSFFYPAEEYNAELIEGVASLCRQGFGELEIHLHHDNDTADQLRETLITFRDHLRHDHGMLGVNEAGETTYGFIHGNWALDNSRSDGRWCGVNNELDILRETGCYADFTMPSAPADCQTRTINSIYYAVDDPDRPKSHDLGTPARVGAAPPADSLLLVQGPLALDWRRRKFGMLPRLENGDLHGGFAPTIDRLRLWLAAAVTVQGRPDWRFVKLHTHGAPERNADMLLGEPMRRFHQQLADLAAAHEGFRYYYVTAREMASLVHQAERGAAEPAFREAVDA